jgi:hypothetical protein
MCNSSTNPYGISRELKFNAHYADKHREEICSAWWEMKCFVPHVEIPVEMPPYFLFRGWSLVLPESHQLNNKITRVYSFADLVVLQLPPIFQPWSLRLQWIPPQPSTPQENGVKFVVKSFLSLWGSLSIWGGCNCQAWFTNCITSYRLRGRTM